MSPDHFRLHMPSVKSQQGSMLVIAIFIIVVLGLLLSALANILNTSQQSVSYEVLGIRAQAAANAGAEVGLYRILRLAQSCNVIASGSTIPTTDIALTIDTTESVLAQCTVAVKCGQRAAINGSTYTFYVLISIATCSSGNNHLTATRTIKSEIQK